MDPISVMRITSSEEAYDEVLNCLRPLTIDAKWRRGERQSRTKVYAESGATFFVCEAEELQKLVEKTRQVLDPLQENLVRVNELGGKISIDFGFDFAGKYWARSLTLGASDLAFFSRFQIEVVVSAYAGGEDDGSDD